MAKKIIFEVTTPVEDSQGNTFWHKLGIASTFVTGSGRRGISVKLNGLPVNGQLTLWEKTDEAPAQAPERSAKRRAAPKRDPRGDLDDEIPF
jgi:hypothetical protein